MPVLDTVNVKELIAHLGVPPERIRMCPLPGQATEKDVILTRPLCELIDGVLVEKAMGYFESRLAVLLAHYLEAFLEVHDLGMVLGEGGMMRVEDEQVRIPDVAFYSWDHFPDGVLPDEQILGVVPDLAVEVLSPTNRPKEMKRKLREYFAGDATLVWYVDPVKRTVKVFTGQDQWTILDESHSLDGGTVLPGFKLSIRKWFARAEHRGKRS